MPARGGTLPRNVRVIWSRLDSGSVAVGTRGTTASLGPIARLAEVPLWRLDTREMGIRHSGQVRIVVGIPRFRARHVLQASPVL